VDVNGTRFHLIKGRGDWLRCQVAPASDGRVAWDDAGEWLTLNPVLSLFPRRDGGMAPALDRRRGAAIDQFGNWYWIAHDRRRIFWQPSGSGRPAVYWAQEPAACPAPAGDFGPVALAEAGNAELAGLAVTTHHYLVAGNASGRGLFRFDLHAGGEPVLLRLSEETPFVPFDLAAAPGGGVWVLDRANHAYWGFDRDFRPLAELALPADEPAPFGPIAGPTPAGLPRRRPLGWPLATRDPISIEALPDGSVLVLDNPALPTADGSAAASTVWRYRWGEQIALPLPLQAEVEVATVGGETTATSLAIVAHDIAYDAEERALYVADGGGKQAIAFGLDYAPTAAWALTVRRDFLPLHYFGGRALVAHAGQVYYDVAAGDPGRDSAVRWVRLRALDEPRYDHAAALLTTVFDGKERDCAWDRLFLDACLPPEAAVRVATRAADDPQLLAGLAFIAEPPLYLRGAGAELPYYDPFPELAAPREFAGAWELLFQRARGRYLQIRLELAGNGRATPRLRALRAYYPRFSYPRRYLPAVYQEDAESANFLERLLANPGGFFSETEGRIEEVSTLFDPLTAPTETLDWLASWLGLVLDPLWAAIQARRQAAAPSGAQPAPDRRRLFIRYARRLYDWRGTPTGLRFALELLLDPCLEATLQRFKDAAIVPNAGLRDQLALLGLPYPTPALDEEGFEALLSRYLLSPQRPTKVRLVERFQARAGRAVAAGDPTGGAAMDTIEASAHRFSVLVPEGLLPEEAAMVTRIVDLEKPAHTAYDVRRYWDYFRVGEARLGLDTTLGEDSRFVPLILGRDYLAAGYLAPDHPLDVPDRLVADRDRIGAAVL
jgi:phage tail-like protein